MCVLPAWLLSEMALSLVVCQPWYNFIFYQNKIKQYKHRKEETMRKFYALIKFADLMQGTDYGLSQCILIALPGM